MQEYRQSIERRNARSAIEDFQAAIAGTEWWETGLDGLLARVPIGVTLLRSRNPSLCTDSHLAPEFSSQ